MKEKYQKRIKFTEEEVHFIKVNSSNMSNEELANKLERSVSGIQKIKREQGLQLLQVWNEDEKQYLGNNYNILTLSQIAKNLGRGISGVQGQTLRLGIRNKSTAKQWNDEEIKILIKNYGIISIKELCELLKRDAQSIRNKAIKLRLTNSPDINRWTEEELEILIKNYSKLPQKELAKLLPNKNKQYITHKANSLGLLKEATINWTDKQMEILENSSNKSLKEISILVGLDVNAVWRKMNKLNLPFLKYGGSQSRKELLNKINVKHYKERYGILLDERKGFDTYTEEEWVDMYLSRNIINIPKVIYDNKIRYFKCLKYFISKFIDISNRDNILNLDSHFKPKGFTLIENYAFKYYSSVNDFLIELFPEFNIKQWEFKMVKKGYFNDIQNVKKYISYIILDIWKCSLENCNEYSKFFTDGYLEDLGYSRVIWIKKNNGFKNYYDLLHTLYGDIIKKEYFKYFIASDGTELDSNEELLVYEFIKDNISNKITATNRERKTNYINNGEMYAPDFLMPCEDKNKKVIIEYFGWYNDKYPDDKRSKDYTDKAKRKIKYFKSLDNAFFVDLYREDLKNNFEGVRNKLKFLACQK